MTRPTALMGVALLFAPFCRPQDNDAQDVQNSAQNAPADLHTLTLEQLMRIKVAGAALHPQSLQDAPASVTVITAEEIRKYGYRTLAEALASVRGFYVNNDHSYTTVGVRGFELPGDYGSHVLVMVNSHSMADNIFDYMLYFGNDFPIDMNLIKQIEIIRGPSSALYGSNAVFATINIITKAPGEAGPPALTADTGSFGEKKGQVVESASWGGAKILLSGTVYNNSGESPLYFPELASTHGDNQGDAIDMDSERGYHFFSAVTWRNWTITAAFSGHDLIQPISWGPTIFNDRGTQNQDQRNFVDADYTRPVAGGALRWRTYYDSIQYIGRGEYALASGGVEENLQKLNGNWVGTQLTYRIRPFFAGDITLGLEAGIDLRARLTDYDVSPTWVGYLNTSRPDRSLALLFQDEKKLSQRWTLDVGLRVDRSSEHRDFVSPRAALLYQRSPWTYKFLYGRSFRNPSLYQLFYGDGHADAANPAANAEWEDTAEIDIERTLGKGLNVQTSAYAYQLHDFLLGIYLPNGLLQYQNAGKIHAEGVELEVNGRPARWLEGSVSYARQRTREESETLENSPANLFKLRLSTPLGSKFDLAGSLQYESSRLTETGTALGQVYLTDFTFTSKHLLPNLDLRLGLRNAFNQRYFDPVALDPVVTSMPQPGRWFFVELISHLRR